MLQRPDSSDSQRFKSPSNLTSVTQLAERAVAEGPSESTQSHLPR